MPVYQQDILIIDIVDPYRLTLGLTKNDDKADMLVNSSLLFFCDKVRCGMWIKLVLLNMKSPSRLEMGFQAARTLSSRCPQGQLLSGT